MSLLPDSVSARIVETFAQRGRDWIRDLPRLRDERLASWQLSVTGPSFSGGTCSYVVPVRRGTDEAVLKIPVVDAENAAEATALYHYDGDGAVRLLDYDRPSGALLLERAVPGTALVRQEWPPREGLWEHRRDVELACRLYRRLWRRPGAHPQGFPALPRAVDLARDWASRFPERGRGRLPAEIVAAAVALCRELCIVDEPEGVGNRDTHLGNVVAATREPWLAIDVKPLLGERSVDAGYLILKQVLTRPHVRWARDAVARTADYLEVPPERARAWAFVRAVDIACDAPEANGAAAVALADSV